MSYIRRKYNQDGSYLINLKGGRKMLPIKGGRKNPTRNGFYTKLQGGNCGCSNCLSGSGFFDEVNQLLPTALGFVPGIGSVLQGTAQGVLNALRPPEDNTPPPVHYSPLIEKQTGQYASNQYQQMLANANKRMSGSGVVDFISRNKWELAPLALSTVIGLAKLYFKDKTKIPKVPAKLVGSGIKEFWNKHKNKIIPLGVASVGALAGLLHHNLSKDTSYKPQAPVYTEYTVKPRAGYVLPFSSETGNYDYLDNMEGSGLFSDVVSGALRGAVSGVPAMISGHMRGQTIRNLQNQINQLKNR